MKNKCCVPQMSY